jgi:hypothetical protein
VLLGSPGEYTLALGLTVERAGREDETPTPKVRDLMTDHVATAATDIDASAE